MSRYKCGGCGEEFSSLRGLPKTQAVPEEDNPTAPTGHGYHSICPNCGYEFHKDKWQEIDEVTHNGNEFSISTVFLNLNHGHGDGDLWYETLVRGDAGRYMDRYETKEEAKRNHQKIKEAIEGGFYYETEYGTLQIDTQFCTECEGTLLYSDSDEKYFCPWCEE